MSMVPIEIESKPGLLSKEELDRFNELEEKVNRYVRANLPAAIPGKRDTSFGDVLGGDFEEWMYLAAKRANLLDCPGWESMKQRGNPQKS